jgi:hypothetical protein
MEWAVFSNQKTQLNNVIAGLFTERNMQNFTAAIKHLGFYEVGQAAVAFFMSALAHVTTEGTIKVASGILAVVVLLIQVRRGYLRNETARVELEIARLKLKKECGE